MPETSPESFDSDLERFKRARGLVRSLHQLREATASVEATVEANRNDGIDEMKAPEGFTLHVSSYGREVYVGDYLDVDHSHGHGLVQSQDIQVQEDFIDGFTAGRIELYDGGEVPIAISPDGTRYCMYPTAEIFVRLVETEQNK